VARARLVSDDAYARLEMVLTLPNELDFHPDAVGKSFDTFIGRRAVTLPRFRWSHDTFRAYAPPPRTGRRDNQWSQFLDQTFASVLPGRSAPDYLTVHRHKSAPDSGM
jgi:hypothetical protein